MLNQKCLVAQTLELFKHVKRPVSLNDPVMSSNDLPKLSVLT